MRIVFFGICPMTIEAANRFIDDEHDVIIIDPDEKKINDLSDEMNCGFLIGNPSYPKVMEEINPKKTDFFFALSDDCQTNIVACLVARSLEIKRTILRVDDASFEQVCKELKLNEVIIPSEVTSQYLFDLTNNENLLELFQYVKDKICLLRKIIKEDEEGKVDQLDIPDFAKVICYLRDEKFYFLEDKTEFKKGDDLLLLSDIDHREEMLDKFNHKDS